MAIAASLAAAPALARPARSGSYSRQGTVGKGSFQGTGSYQRGNGSLNHQYNGTRTGPKGQTSTVNRQDTATRTGKNTWHRDSSHSVTGPNGQTRTRTATGDGNIQKTENGYTKSYEGTITTNKGKTVEVDKQVDVTKNADGTVTKEREVEYSKPDGTTLGTGQSTTTVTPGQGSTTTGTFTGPNGQTRNGSATTQWKYVDGKWVKTVDGQRVDSTTTVTPSK